MSVGLTRAVALTAPQIFQLTHRLGEATVVKLLVLLLKSFVDSVRVPDKLGPADIIEVADTLAQTYTHDSIKHILLALKEARTSGTIFYQALDASQIYAIINSIRNPLGSKASTTTARPRAAAWSTAPWPSSGSSTRS